MARPRTQGVLILCYLFISHLFLTYDTLFLISILRKKITVTQSLILLHIISFCDDFLYIYFRYAVSVRWEREQAERTRPPTESSGPVIEHKPCLTFTIEDFNRYFCCCARRVGSMFFLIEGKDGSPIVVAGPCWPFCTFVTAPLIVVLSGLVGYFIVSNPDTGLVSIGYYIMYHLSIQFNLIFMS